MSTTRVMRTLLRACASSNAVRAMRQASGAVVHASYVRPQHWMQTCCVRSFSAALPPHTKVAMPALSPTMTAGTIVKWHKNEGDALNPGDLVAEVATDKATVDFECQDSGYLAKILVPSGTTDVTVGRLIAIMVDSRDAVDAFKDVSADSLLGSSAPSKAAPAPAPAAAPVAPSPTPAPTPTPAAPTPKASTSGTDRIFASPLAKKLASESGLSLNDLKSGTGPNGRIIAADIKDLLASGKTASVSAPAPAAAAPAASITTAADVTRAGYTDIPHTQMRRVIAQRLTASKQTVPHYTLTADVNLDALLTLRQTLNATLEGDAKLSVNDFIIKASALALRKVPEMNSSWLEHAVRAYDYVDVSVAVSIPEGLITPIVKDADKTGLLGISKAVKELAAKAKAKQLSPAEYQGGTFTISNLGMYGVRQFSAIINPPQAGILAVGAAERRVVPDTTPGAALPYKQAVVMSATLSCDHRVVDGAVGAQWLAAFKNYLENPNTMLL